MKFEVSHYIINFHFFLYSYRIQNSPNKSLLIIMLNLLTKLPWPLET